MVKIWPFIVVSSYAHVIIEIYLFQTGINSNLLWASLYERVIILKKYTPYLKGGKCLGISFYSVLKSQNLGRYYAFIFEKKLTKSLSLSISLSCSLFLSLSLSLSHTLSLSFSLSYSLSLSRAFSLFLSLTLSRVRSFYLSLPFSLSLSLCQFFVKRAKTSIGQ